MRGRNAASGKRTISTMDRAEAPNFAMVVLPNSLMPRQNFSRARCGARHCLVMGLALAALLGGCATVQTQAPAPVTPEPAAPPASAPSRPLPNFRLSGYPPAFKEGFGDGCDSFRGNYRRDNTRFGKDNNYTIGWQDGFSICRRQASQGK